MIPNNSDSILILLFPPGCGGNHLANLLSLTDRFQKRMQTDEYMKGLLEKYAHSTFNHHVGSLENLRTFVYPNSLEELKAQPGIPIICSHVIEYYNFIQFDSPYDIFTNWSFRDIVVFTFPDENSIAYKRFYPYRHGESIDNNDELADIPISKYKTFYDPNVIIASKGFNCYKHRHENLRKVTQFDTEKFMSPDGFEYAQNYFQINYDVVIPDNGRILHKFWYKKISNLIY